MADKEAIDAELQVGALKRRLALLEEESDRNKVIDRVLIKMITRFQGEIAREH